MAPRSARFELGEAMLLWHLNPKTWRELDAVDRAFCVAHYRLKNAYEAQASHVGRKVSEILAKEKKDGKNGMRRVPIVTPFGGWTPPS